MAEKKFKSLPVVNAEKIDKLEKEIDEIKTKKESSEFESIKQELVEIIKKIETIMVKIDENGVQIETVKKLVDEDREKIESLNFEII
jgi:uncharacterized damage-inducible protein DinB